MSPLVRVFLVACAVTLAASTTSEVTAAPPGGPQPGWSPVIVATGNYRQQLQATPIEYRPNRPFHVYGNVVRRRYHQGTYLPSPRQILPSSVYRGR